MVPWKRGQHMNISPSNNLRADSLLKPNDIIFILNDASQAAIIILETIDLPDDLMNPLLRADIKIYKCLGCSSHDEFFSGISYILSYEASIHLFNPPKRKKLSFEGAFYARRSIFGNMYENWDHVISRHKSICFMYANEKRHFADNK